MKTLKSHTIIPQQLYVDRDADRQVKEIINDFGRPGYVLVARQMGKTNLLINAKRNFENENRRFVYIDLSSLFEEPRACFRNIIDTAFETNEEYFTEAYNEILEARKNPSLAPHKEYEKELRTILEHYAGELVIILDEIDALTRASYSDQIFSQIRSIYFTRTNFPEYERLTYLLSGVVEPKEIIKNPKISPFNIGQKIWLADFSFDEFKSFLEKSSLKLDEFTVKRIFYWTSGNPRMTWDICSRIEDYILESEKVNVAAIDKIVTEIYLSSYDHPPVDHIRELVANDRDIKNAIIQIRYKKGNTLSDGVKTKLYLAGISDYNKDRVEIKNRIIDLSLSEEWLSNLDESTNDLLVLIINSYQAEKYEDCEKYGRQYLALEENKESASMMHHYIGASCFLQGKYEEAEDHLLKAELSLQIHGVLYSNNEYYKAFNYSALAKHKECSEVLEKFVKEDESRENFYYQALLQISHINIFYLNNLDSVENYLNQVINEIDDCVKSIEQDVIVKRKVSAYLHLGMLANKEGKDLSESLKYFQRAEELSNEESIPHVLSTKLSLIEESNSQFFEVFERLFESVSSLTSMTFQKGSDYSLRYRYSEYCSFLPLVFRHKKEKFWTFLESTRMNLFDEKFADVDIVYNSALHYIQRGRWELSSPMLQEIVNIGKLESKRGLQKIEVIKLLAVIQDENWIRNSEFYEKEFNNIYEKEELIDVLDFHVFTLILRNKLKNEEFDEGLTFINKIFATRNKISDLLKVNLVVIYDLKSLFHHKLRDIAAAKESDRQLIKLGQNFLDKKMSTSLLSESNLSRIVQDAKKRLNPESTRPKQPTTNKIIIPSGNDWVKIVNIKNGTSVINKYKLIKHLLKNSDFHIKERYAQKPEHLL